MPRTSFPCVPEHRPKIKGSPFQFERQNTISEETMSHLLAADSRNSKVQNAVVPRGVPRSTWSLPNDARPQEGNRQARRRQAEARRLQRKARQPQAKGAVL